MRVILITVPCSGSNGSATGSQTLFVAGLVALVEWSYTNAPDTTDITITADGQTLATISNSNTAGRRTPGMELVDSSGSGLGSYIPFSINSLTVNVAGANSNSVITVKAHIHD